MKTAILLFLICLSSSVYSQDSDFQIDAAVEYLLYSYASYCQDDSVRAWDCYWCQNISNPLTIYEAFYVVEPDSYAYIGYTSSNEIIVAFRGTQSLENWIYDLKSAVQVPYNNGTAIGKGFAQIWDEYVAALPEAVLELANQLGTDKVVVTGHSLGGAIATLCAQYLSDYIPNVVTYTFGSPRVGDYLFADLFNITISNSYRVVNKDDIVPHLPYYDVDKFHHVPRELWFYEGGAGPYVECSLSGEDKSCADSIPTVLFSVHDHLTYFGINLDDGNNYGC